MIFKWILIVLVLFIIGGAVYIVNIQQDKPSYTDVTLGDYLDILSLGKDKIQPLINGNENPILSQNTT